jgi:hypothetical protein
MKIRFSILILFLFSGGLVFSQKTATGYYIALNNDSVPARFKIPKRLPNTIFDAFRKWIDFSDLREEVDMVDSAGTITRLTPVDIKGFAFTYDSVVYKLFSKPIEPYKKNFLLPEVMGRKVRLFVYTVFERGMPATLTPSGFTGGTPSKKDYYWTFEKYDHTFMFVNTRTNKREMIRMLNEYFKDSPQVLDMIHDKIEGQLLFLKTLRDALKSIVETYNAG